MQHLNYQFKSRKIIDEENGVFEGYASVFGQVDHQSEAVMAGAFKNSIIRSQKEKQPPKMLWQHNSTMPIGLWEEIREDDYGLYVRGKILLEIQLGKDAYALLKSNIIDGLSIGFQVKKSHREKNIRILEEVDLFEISLVTFTANPLAKVTSCKSWTNTYDSTTYLMKRLHDLKIAMDQADRQIKSLTFD